MSKCSPFCEERYLFREQAARLKLRTSRARAPLGGVEVTWGEPALGVDSEAIRLKTLEASTRRWRAQRWSADAPKENSLHPVVEEFLQDGDVHKLVRSECSGVTTRDLIEATVSAQQEDRANVATKLAAAAQVHDDSDLFIGPPLVVAATLEFARAATKVEILEQSDEWAGSKSRAARDVAKSGWLSQPFIHALGRLAGDPVAITLRTRAERARQALANTEQAAAQMSFEPSPALERAQAWRIDIDELSRENKQKFDEIAQLPTDQRGFDPSSSSKQVALVLAALIKAKRPQQAATRGPCKLGQPG